MARLFRPYSRQEERCACPRYPPASAKNRRSLLLQTAAFAVGGYFVALPDRATDLAHVVGIGRGVDFFLYPTVIWLVRESLLTRRRRLDDAERLTQAVRAMAIAAARVIDAPAAGQQAKGCQL